MSTEAEVPPTRIPSVTGSDLELAAFMVLVVVCTRSRLASQEWCRACRTVNEHRGRSTADANPVGDWFRSGVGGVHGPRGRLHAVTSSEPRMVPSVSYRQ